MMHMMNNGHGGWMIGGMGLLHVLFWILIIVGVALIVQWFFGHEEESASEILKKRYAKGKIDSVTFEQMKKNIDEGEGS